MGMDAPFESLLHFLKSRNSKRKTLWAVPAMPFYSGYVANLFIINSTFFARGDEIELKSGQR